MCLFVCVSMCVCVQCVSLCLFLCVYVCVCVCICVCIAINKYVCKNIIICLCVFNFLYACIYACIYASINIIQVTHVQENDVYKPFYFVCCTDILCITYNTIGLPSDEQTSILQSRQLDKTYSKTYGFRYKLEATVIHVYI